MTTEERIAQIAQGFGQGYQNFQAQQQNKQALSLAEEARKRQQAIQEIELANTIANQYGKEIMPEQVRPLVQGTGSLGDILASAPESRKGKLEEMKALAEIRKLTNPTGAGSYKEQLQIKKLESDLAKRTDPLEKLGTEGKKLLGIANEGLNAVIGMQEAFDKGDRPGFINPSLPVVGALVPDTAFTANQRAAAEMFGRLQSGGAINKQEEERFMAMGPRPSDPPNIAKKKLASQKAALEDRMKILGVTPEILSKAGISRRSSINTSEQEAIGTPLIVNEAQASDDPEFLEYQMLLKKAGM